MRGSCSGTHRRVRDLAFGRKVLPEIRDAECRSRPGEGPGHGFDIVDVGEHHLRTTAGERLRLL
jgi:hypothetical protein